VLSDALGEHGGVVARHVGWGWSGVVGCRAAGGEWLRHREDGRFTVRV